MKHLSRRVLGIVLACTSLAAEANVTATLNQDRVGPGDTVQLTLQRDRSGGGDPDLTPLKKDFDILGTSTATSIQYINGHVSQQHQLQLMLAPKHGGVIEIPPLTWAGEQTAPLQLTIAGSSSANGGTTQTGNDSPAAAGSSQHVFLTGSLDSATPYVQGAAVLSVRLHTDQSLQQAGLDLPGNADVTVQSIGKDQQSSESRNGHRYQVIERKYLLVPQRSGSITLEGPTLDAQVADMRGRNPFNDDDSFFSGTPFAGMMGGLRSLRIHGDPIRLEVQPRPAAATSGPWLPAKQLTLEQTRTPQSGSVHAGEPLTVHLKLQANGLTASQLPDLSQLLILPEGLRAYPDQAKLNTSVQSGALVSTREQDIALIADRGGQYTIPPVRISWWDTTQNTARELTLALAPIDIAASAGGGSVVSQPPSATNHEQTAATVTSPSDGSDSIPTIHLGDRTITRQAPWIWISGALTLLWLATMIVLWRLKRRSASAPLAPMTPKKTPPSLTVSNAKNAFHQACKDNMPHLARRHLLSWASQAWPSHPPRGLEEIAAVIDDARATQLLEQLDRACFIGGEWVGEALSAKLTTLPRETGQNPETEPPLRPSLYL
jgi:hypothetical protein